MSILAERLNAEPVVMRGYTSSELMTVLIVGVIVWMIVCAGLGALFGDVRMGLGFSFLMTLLTVFLFSPVLKNMKRNRPDHYYQHWVAVKLHHAGLKKSPFILRTGTWSLGRT